MTEQDKNQRRWEALARALAPWRADAIEENVRDQGYEPETEEFWSRCVDEAEADEPAPPMGCAEFDYPETMTVDEMLEGLGSQFRTGR